MSSFYIYIDAPSANLTCCICRNTFTEPTTIRSCSHTFCRDCILNALDHTSQCPIDRSPVTQTDLVPADPIIRSIVDELLVECLHRPSGCTHTCQRQHLANHLRESCLYSDVPCPEGKCDKSLTRKEAKVHSHLSEGYTFGQQEDFALEKTSLPLDDAISTKATQCSFCSVHIDKNGRDQHQNECGERPFPCPHASLGCPFTATTYALENEHIPTCIYETLKGFFLLNNVRMTSLAEENMLLRSRIQNMEGTIRTMKSEMAIVKGTLGPWCRPATNPSPPSQASPTTSLGPQAVAHPHAEPPATDVYSELASYFPEYMASSDQLRSNHRASGSLNQIHELPNLLARMTTQTHIAPLNLTTSLEGSLAGLRESLVTVAASVDSMGRRNEIALSNEVMRLGEEIMSLRANVHGLRMQVHAIMMDRNAQVTRGVEGSDIKWPAMQIPLLPRPQGNPPSVTKL